MAEFQAAPGGGGGPSHLTSHEEGQLQSPLQSGRCLPPHYEKWAGHLVRWDGRDRNVAGNVNSNSGLPLPSCVFWASLVFRPLFSQLSNGNVGLTPLRESSAETGAFGASQEPREGQPQPHTRRGDGGRGGFGGRLAGPDPALRSRGARNSAPPEGRPASPAWRLLPGSAPPQFLSRAVSAHFAQTRPRVPPRARPRGHGPRRRRLPHRSPSAPAAI